MAIKLKRKGNIQLSKPKKSENSEIELEVLKDDLFFEDEKTRANFYDEGNEIDEKGLDTKLSTVKEKYHFMSSFLFVLFSISIVLIPGRYIYNQNEEIMVSRIKFNAIKHLLEEKNKHPEDKTIKIINDMPDKDKLAIKSFKDLSFVSRIYGKGSNISVVNYAVYECKEIVGLRFNNIKSVNWENPIKIKSLDVIGGISGKIVKYEVAGKDYCSYRL